MEVTYHGFASNELGNLSVGAAVVDEDKRKAKIVLHGHADDAATRAPTELPKWTPMRTQEQLMPLALRVAENVKLMQRFHSVMGSGDEDLGADVMEEVSRYAQSLDPNMSAPEGTRIVVLLMKIVGDSKGK
jgi:hypothetical protein